MKTKQKLKKTDIFCNISFQILSQRIKIIKVIKLI